MRRYDIIIPADRRLVLAYRAVFTGNGTSEDARLVMADLEKESGFRMVTPPEADLGSVKFAEGQRSIYARIETLTRIGDAALDDIEAAERDRKGL